LPGHTLPPSVTSVVSDLHRALAPAPDSWMKVGCGRWHTVRLLYIWHSSREASWGRQLGCLFVCLKQKGAESFVAIPLPRLSDKPTAARSYWSCLLRSRRLP